MKKLFRNFLMMAGVGAVAVLSSCDETTELLEDGPTVTITTSESVYSAGATADINVSFTAQAELVGAVLNIETDNSVTVDPVVLDLNQFGVASDTAGQFTVQITVPSELAGAEAIVSVTVEDGNAKTATDELTFDVVDAINFYEAVLFGGQGNSEEGFYNALDDDRLSYGEARDASTVNSSPVDFAYYYGNTNENTIASIDDDGLNAVYTSVELPIEGNFGSRNETRFRVTDISPSDFDDIETETALIAAADSELNDNSSATNLSVGSVVAFELDAARGGYLGLAKVTTIDDTNGTGTITIEVKVQKAD